MIRVQAMVAYHAIQVATVLNQVHKLLLESVMQVICAMVVQRHQDLSYLALLLILVKCVHQEDTVRLDHLNRNHVKEDSITQTVVERQYLTAESANQESIAKVKLYQLLLVIVIMVTIAKKPQL